jgi:hypothetical protein
MGPNASMAGKDPRELSGRAIIAQQSGGSGVIIALAALFATPEGTGGIAASFAEAVRHGPAAPAALPEAARATTEAGIANGFSVAFLTVGASPR